MSNLVTINGKQGNIEGELAISQFRYSKAKFRTNLIIAAALTGLVCLFTYMLLGIYGSYRINLYTGIVGLIFFAFLSVKTIRQYIQSNVILAIRPTGLYDARWSTQAVAWEDIKEITLGQREAEFILSVWLWPNKNAPVPINQNPSETFTIDLEPLESEPSKIVELIGRYKTVRISD